MKILTQKDIDRFLGKVDKEKSDIFYNGIRCWEWIARRSSKNYGIIDIDGRAERAHRISWGIFYKEYPDNLYVLHHCDNPLCVNPTHLFLGTQTDNMRDMVEKKRGNHHTKLTWEKVREIRSRYKWYGFGGENMKTLSKKFGVDDSVIYDIVRNKSWKE